jgi:P-type E1-E2 ATPase
LKKEVKEVMDKISRYVKVFVITADTYETADSELGAANVSFIKVERSSSGEEKAKVVRELGPEKVVAIGNGANDALMLKEAALGIAVIGEEGCSTALIKEADLVVTDIMNALGLVAYPERLVATLRD